MRPGRHGGMASSELEMIIARNGNFLSVRRAGDGDGQASVYNNVTGDFVGAIGGGWLPEYSCNTKPAYKCECTPTGTCRTGAHGLGLVRGWRNILYELLAKRRISLSKEIRRTLGSHSAIQAFDYGMVTAPMADPSPSWNHSTL